MKNEDVVLESNTTYGDEKDVGTSNQYAKNMVIVKVNGNLTINSGATLTAYGTAYGGPKGMLIYSSGTLTNNGTISMTARGAKAQGQNVYLWKNADTTIRGVYEFVPKLGASGAAAVGSYSNGRKGTDGIDRQVRTEVALEVLEKMEGLEEVEMELHIQEDLEEELEEEVQEEREMTMEEQVEMQEEQIIILLVQEEEQETQVELIVLGNGMLIQDKMEQVVY